MLLIAFKKGGVIIYRTAKQHYLQKFGCKVYKLSLSGGFTCPNRDGTKGVGGCSFCSDRGSGEFTAPPCQTIEKQLTLAKQKVAHKNKGGKYLAYFQSFTNTYSPVSRLRSLFTAAISPDDIVGLSVATRPDCLGEDVLTLLSELNQIKPVTVELGLQTAKEETAANFNRCYSNAEYITAVAKLKAVGIEVITHILIGLPNETLEDITNTTRFVVANHSDGVKFHLLYVVRGTKLEQEYLAGRYTPLRFCEYASILKECLRLLPAETVVHRITGDGDKKTLVAPLWSADKKRVLNDLRKYLKA